MIYNLHQSLLSDIPPLLLSLKGFCTISLNILTSRYWNLAPTPSSLHSDCPSIRFTRSWPAFYSLAWSQERDLWCSAATSSQNKSSQVNYLQQQLYMDEVSGGVEMGPSTLDGLQIGLPASVRVSLIKRSILERVTQETTYSYTSEHNSL